MQQKVGKSIAQLQTIDSAFSDIAAPFEAPPPGDSEIEIKIPADYETGTLHDLSREAKEWHRDLSTISEVFDPERPQPTIRTLATGSWEFYLASTPLVLFGIAKCIKGINSILSELINGKKLLKQLLETKAPIETTESFEAHLNGSAAKNLDALATMLVDEYYKANDDGRRAELRNALTQALKRLSKKLSEGSRVSLRLTKPAKPKVSDAENPTPEEAEALAEAARITKIQEDVMLEVAGTPSLEYDSSITAALPAPDDEFDK